MSMKTLKRQEAQKLMVEWIKDSSCMPEVDSFYLKMRNELQNAYKDVKEKYSRDYEIDIHFGIYLYNYFEKIASFNMRTASDDGFWRYLSLKVVPDLVTDRWGKDNEAHFWKRGNKIWLRTLWWYIYLSWQENVQKTLDVIESPGFTTDTILNLIDRSGKGYYIGVYRNIMYLHSRVPKEKLAEFNRNTVTKADSLFRVIMKLNTARTKVIEPALYTGGEREYARSLFNDLGINV
ncbi:hypothetical protein NE172_03610 [Clostridium botulinum]|uniref:Uncharacterized protein n=1 Tax=Clostridium botulinum TaxID=1491 RepID=A0A6B4JJM1_CLOBO|nr:hypothetical protein [Clostridium botulinum]EES50930.1 conserved hypothetical protein [Clostridium botulinum E1 str. 'BoNT E Beluga']MBY6760247.1 hypothetical protein [Clostridium botulinum]MBY6919154.1 hypothetical protein [Clostridium botulinum]MCR1130028.1 hypothetical protein [Clostridium botulinum]NFJ57204.1 hypothetical protein [Clostridium botulinum]